jgi:hypothetical protein
MSTISFATFDLAASSLAMCRRSSASSKTYLMSCRLSGAKFRPDTNRLMGIM